MGKMKSPIVVIGGSGFANRLEGKRDRIKTPYGTVPVLVSKIGDHEIIAIKRHADPQTGEGHMIPPHMVRYHAHVNVAKVVGAEAILASSAVGVMDKRRYNPGDLILCSDFIGINVTLRGNAVTFFDDFKDGIHHTPVGEAISSRLNSVLLRAAAELSLTMKEDAVVTLTSGPRYESPAEIRALRILGAHLVGMTAVYEIILAAEQGTPYAVVAIGTNWAAGIGKKPLSHAEVEEMMERKGSDLFALMSKAIQIM